jgi:hypothetical protein
MNVRRWRTNTVNALARHRAMRISAIPGRGWTWANGRTSRTSTSAPELPGGAAGVPSAVVPCAPSPRHRPPTLRSFVRADADATELPPAVSLSNRDDGDGFVVGDNDAQHHAGDRGKEDRLPASRCAPLHAIRASRRISQVVVSRGAPKPARAGRSKPANAVAHIPHLFNPMQLLI